MEKQTIHFNPPLGGHLLEDININSNTQYCVKLIFNRL